MLKGSKNTRNPGRNLQSFWELEVTKWQVEKETIDTSEFIIRSVFCQ